MILSSPPSGREGDSCPVGLFPHRLVVCRACGHTAAICMSCDHGQIYCPQCAPVRSQERRHRAQRTYRATGNGAQKRALQAKRRRLRLASRLRSSSSDETFEGDRGTATFAHSVDLGPAALLPPSAEDTSHAASLSDPSKPPADAPVSAHTPRARVVCAFCGAACSEFVRTLGFRRARKSQAATRVPGGPLLRCRPPPQGGRL